MHVFSQAFANMLSQKYLGFAIFRKYNFAGFRKLSREFANMVSQQGFAGVKIMVFPTSFSTFSQGFAMGTLLMVLGARFHPPRSGGRRSQASPA